jgi:hypothetical protein
MMDIGKEAVTIHVFIDSIQGSAWDHQSFSYRQVKTVKKAVNKFLKHMKASEYYYLSSEKYADNYYQNILNHLDTKLGEGDKESDYLTWLQYQIHSFIKDVFPEYYDGFFRVKGYNKFYKKILQRLLE